MQTRRVHIVIRGEVQGVFFRQSAQAEAQRLSLRGWVRNLPSGEVESVAEGSLPSVSTYLTFCRRGPSSARVDHVDVEDVPTQGALPSPFAVERG